MNFFDEFFWLRIVIISIGLIILFAVRKKKPWWELTNKEKKKRLPYIVTGIALAVVGLITFFVIYSVFN